MRVFDWMTLLREQRIPFITAGPNVKRGEVNVRCPFCGSADPSKHMGLQLDTGWWSCWRNRAQHSGKSPVRLIMAILGVPYHKAREVAGLDEQYVDPEGFDALAARLLQKGKTGRPEEQRRRKLILDPSYRPIRARSSTGREYAYLREERGFNGRSRAGEDVDVLCELYGLHAGAGDFSGRIICPFYFDGELVTWTGRAIAPSSMRYRDLSIDESILAPKETLFNHDALLDQTAKVLLVTEGPFDALKVDFYGEPYGLRAVALSTNSIQEDQAFLLQTAVGTFDRVLIAMDNKTTFGAVDSMRMKQSLSFFGDVLGIAHIPFGAGDPGELTPAQVIQWATDLGEQK